MDSVSFVEMSPIKTLDIKWKELQVSVGDGKSHSGTEIRLHARITAHSEICVNKVPDGERYDDVARHVNDRQ